MSDLEYRAYKRRQLEAFLDLFRQPGVVAGLDRLPGEAQQAIQEAFSDLQHEAFSAGA